MMCCNHPRAARPLVVVSDTTYFQLHYSSVLPCLCRETKLLAGTSPSVLRTCWRRIATDLPLPHSLSAYASVAVLHSPKPGMYEGQCQPETQTKNKPAAGNHCGLAEECKLPLRTYARLSIVSILYLNCSLIRRLNLSLDWLSKVKETPPNYNFWAKNFCTCAHGC